MIHQIISSLPSFKNLDTLKSGLNVLLAEKSAGATDKQTRNRAGKSSLIEIVHFLLCSDAGKDSIFRTPDLLDATFAMGFDLRASRQEVMRSGSTKSKVQIVGPLGLPQSIAVSEWCEILGEEMFGLTTLQASGSKPPTFRSLISYFVRRQASTAFVTPEKQAVMQGTGDMQISLMFLLDLDWQIARDWQGIRDREKTLEELKKAAGSGAFGAIIGKSSDLRTQLTIEEARLKRLQVESANYNVLPEYKQLEVETSALTRQLNDLSNSNTLDLSAIRDLEEALVIEVAPEPKNLKEVYEQAGVVLPNLVTQRYEDVKTFHESVVRNRRDYLTSELEAARRRIEQRDAEKAQVDRRRSQVMNLLSTHGALDNFLKLQAQQSRLAAEVESLRQRFESAEQLEGTKNELEIERNHLAIRLRRDFAEQRDKLADAIVAFEEVSSRLYESAGSMTIEDTQNGPVFRFVMQGQRSKGIKNMQIFCFDMMLMRLCAKRKIGPGFLIHDSHLFDGVDGRQLISALKLGAELAAELKFQYIVTMNEDDAFKERLDDFSIDDYVLPIRLNDSTSDGGLFGIRFG